MGRYYSGDIEGKFWFAVQSSTAADRFGREGYQPNFITYIFEKEDLPTVLEEIGEIEHTLGDNKQKIEDFFKENNGYNDVMLSKAEITASMLSEYADLLLGYQIRDSIIEKGQCCFDAEL